MILMFWMSMDFERRGKMKLTLTDNDGTVIADWSILAGKPEFDIDEQFPEPEHDFYLEGYEDHETIWPSLLDAMHYAKGQGKE